MVEQPYDDPGVVTNEINNLALYTMPAPNLPDGSVMMFLGIAADPKNSLEAPLLASLPPDFNGKHVAHFIALEGSSLGKLFKQEVLDEQQLSHVALLTGGEQTPDTMYFDGDPIKQKGVILWYSKARNKYYFIHCRSCATMIASWLSNEQDTWQKIAKMANLSAASSVLN